MNNKK
jgi:hypothetical protein